MFLRVELVEKCINVNVIAEQLKLFQQLYYELGNQQAVDVEVRIYYQIVNIKIGLCGDVYLHHYWSEIVE